MLKSFKVWLDIYYNEVRKGLVQNAVDDVELVSALECKPKKHQYPLPKTKEVVADDTLANHVSVEAGNETDEKF